MQDWFSLGYFDKLEEQPMNEEPEEIEEARNQEIDYDKYEYNWATGLWEEIEKATSQVA